MSQTTISVHRSEQWVREQRLARGTNVRDTIDVIVAVTDLSTASREVLLQAGRGQYPSILHGLAYDTRGAVTGWSYNGWGLAKLRVDSDAPTPAEIDQAIQAAVAEIAAAKEKHAAEEAAKAAAAEEASRKRAQLAAARELLAEEIAAVERVAASRRADCATLSTLLRHVPQDALRGALRAWTAAESGEHADSLRAQAEEAYSFRGLLFEDDDEDNDED